MGEKWGEKKKCIKIDDTSSNLKMLKRKESQMSELRLHYNQIDNF